MFTSFQSGFASVYNMHIKCLVEVPKLVITLRPILNFFDILAIHKYYIYYIKDTVHSSAPIILNFTFVII